MIKKILILTLFLLFLPLQAFAETDELEEDMESPDFPHLIQISAEVHPKLFVKKKEPGVKFMKFKISYQFSGRDYSFEDIDQPVLASFFCKFGPKYEYETPILWNGQLPLKDSQIITKEVVVPVPKKYVNLLNRKNYCTTYPNSITIENNDGYWLKKIKNKLTLTPDKQDAAFTPKEMQTSVLTIPAKEQSSASTDALAKCLALKEVTLYSAVWCPHCDKQKELFGDAFKYINYVECFPSGGNIGTPQAQICINKNITGWPTWELKNGKQMMGFMTLDQLAEKTGCGL